MVRIPEIWKKMVLTTSIHECLEEKTDDDLRDNAAVGC